VEEKMIVKVGNQKVDSRDYPVLVEFTDEELEMIRKFEPDQTAIYSYPAESNELEIEEWVTKRINEDEEETEGIE
jgi:hypothetical protein